MYEYTRVQYRDTPFGVIVFIFQLEQLSKFVNVLQQYIDGHVYSRLLDTFLYERNFQWNLTIAQYIHNRVQDTFHFSRCNSNNNTHICIYNKIYTNMWTQMLHFWSTIYQNKTIKDKSWGKMV